MARWPWRNQATPDWLNRVRASEMFPRRSQVSYRMPSPMSTVALSNSLGAPAASIRHSVWAKRTESASNVLPSRSTIAAPVRSM